MDFKQVTTRIIELCQDNTLDFQGKADLIQNALEECSSSQILEHLDYAGIIPECFAHDSTEEKLFAKYCDALLSKSWRELNLEAHVIQERSDAADVIATGNGYTIVGDAKAFRLSRTAKNQKDFKVEALDKWRKGADYAVLVCPLYQYPNKSSQIYLQAKRYNVVLLSYTHLVFLIKNKPTETSSLENLWKITRTIPESKDAERYWNILDNMMLSLTGKREVDWEKAKEATYSYLSLEAKEQINYLEQEKKRIENLPHDVAVKLLIEAMKIDTKIDVICRTAGITL